jgi:hypothetical protein
MLSKMNLAAASGSLVSAGAMRRGPAPAAQFVVGVRDVVVVVVVPVVGLLLGLLLITAGCGPPN